MSTVSEKGRQRIEAGARGEYEYILGRKLINEEVLRRVNEKRGIGKIMKWSRKKWVGYVKRHNRAKNRWKDRKRRPRKQTMCQFVEEVGAGNYQKMKKLVMNMKL